MNHEIRSGRSFITSKGYLESINLKVDDGVFIDPHEKSLDGELDNHEGDKMHIVKDSEGNRIGVFYSTSNKFYPDSPNYNF